MASLLPNDAQANYILSLADISQHDVERVGVKAAHLGEMARTGFPVPNGFVLTTDAFDRFLMANALGPDIFPEDMIAATLPADVAEALLAAANALGDLLLAVRSSGSAEDLPGASFAGQYETVLDVRGAEALVAAVQRVFASAFGHRVTVYHAAQGQHARGRMAVLVQRQVEAIAAGVAFTANPVTGNRAEVVISALYGSGTRRPYAGLRGKGPSMRTRRSLWRRSLDASKRTSSGYPRTSSGRWSGMNYFSSRLARSLLCPSPSYGRPRCRAPGHATSGSASGWAIR